MSQPLLVFGGRKRIHFGVSNCPHLSKALASAYVPLQVVLFPVLWNVRSCVQPAKARRAKYNKVGGVRTSRSEVHLRKASRSILRNLLERLSCCRCKQCAKVDPNISLTSVRERSTLKLQTALAGCRSNPREVWWQGERDDPGLQETALGQASRQICGSYSVCSKLRCRNAVHFSKARGRNCACGAS